jgi:hypothetical protein
MGYVPYFSKKIFKNLLFSSTINRLKIKRYLELFLKKCSAGSAAKSESPGPLARLPGKPSTVRRNQS